LDHNIHLQQFHWVAELCVDGNVGGVAIKSDCDLTPFLTGRSWGVSMEYRLFKKNAYPRSRTMNARSFFPQCRPRRGLAFLEGERSGLMKAIAAEPGGDVRDWMQGQSV
jgi:hypothetical protein